MNLYDSLDRATLEARFYEDPTDFALAFELATRLRRAGEGRPPAAMRGGGPVLRNLITQLLATSPSASSRRAEIAAALSSPWRRFLECIRIELLGGSGEDAASFLAELAAGPTNLETLRHLEIVAKGAPIHPEPVDVAALAKRAPRLRQLVLRGVRVAPGPLSHDTLHHVALSDGGGMTAMRRWELPQLAWLELERVDASGLVSLLDGTRFPTLQHLGLVGARRANELLGALSAPCSLHTLDLRGSDVDSHGLEEIRRHPERFAELRVLLLADTAAAAEWTGAFERCPELTVWLDGPAADRAFVPARRDELDLGRPPLSLTRARPGGVLDDPEPPPYPATEPLPEGLPAPAQSHAWASVAAFRPEVARAIADWLRGLEGTELDHPDTSRMLAPALRSESARDVMDAVRERFANDAAASACRMLGSAILAYETTVSLDDMTELTQQLPPQPDAALRDEAHWLWKLWLDRHPEAWKHLPVELLRERLGSIGDDEPHPAWLAATVGMDEALERTRRDGRPDPLLYVAVERGDPADRERWSDRFPDPPRAEKEPATTDELREIAIMTGELSAEATSRPWAQDAELVQRVDVPSAVARLVCEEDPLGDGRWRHATRRRFFWLHREAPEVAKRADAQILATPGHPLRGLARLFETLRSPAALRAVLKPWGIPPSLAHPPPRRAPSAIADACSRGTLARFGFLVWLPDALDSLDPLIGSCPPLREHTFRIENAVIADPDEDEDAPYEPLDDRFRWPSGVPVVIRARGPRDAHRSPPIAAEWPAALGFLNGLLERLGAEERFWLVESDRLGLPSGVLDMNQWSSFGAACLTPRQAEGLREVGIVELRRPDSGVG